MSLFTFLIVISASYGAAQESPHGRRIRFPTEIKSQGNGGTQMYGAESQVQPIIITAGNGIVATPHFVLPKVPTLENPFGQVGNKGYAEGIIIPYDPSTKGQQNFHQTVPPPQQTAYFGPGQSFFIQRLQSSGSSAQPPPQNNKSPQPPHQHNRPSLQQPERHRFSPQRLSYDQLKRLNPTQHGKQQIHVSGMNFIKDAQQHPDIASYRYSIVTNHGPPRDSSPDEFEMEINHGISEFDNFSPPDIYSTKPYPVKSPQFSTKAPTQSPPYFNKGQRTSSQRPKTTKEPGSSSDEDFFNFDEGIGDWEIKGNFEDPHPESDLFFDKKKNGNRQQINNFPTPGIIKPSNGNRHSNNNNNFQSNKNKNSNVSRPPSSNFQGFSSYFGEDQKPRRQPSNSFSKPSSNQGKFHETPSHQANDYNRYFPTPGNSEYKRGEVKSVFPPPRETLKNRDKGKKITTKFPLSFDSIKSIEPSSDFSDEDFPSEFDFHETSFKNHDKKHSKTNNRGNSEFPIKSFKNLNKQKNLEEFNFDFDFPEQPFKINEKENSNENFDFGFEFPQSPSKKQPNGHANSKFEFDFDYPEQPKVNNKGQSSNSNFGSEWIPINAPEGAVPAKSYDIPAPDLSRASFQENRPARRERPRERDDGNLIYGLPKRGNSEGVVSAVFRVKQ